MSKLGQHQSLSKAARRRVQALEDSPLVTGIKIGRTDNCRHKFAPGTLKLQRAVDAGLKVNCYGDNGVTTIYVYCDKHHVPEVSALLDH